VDVKTFHDLVLVKFHGLQRHVQTIRNLLAGLPECNKSQHFELSESERPVFAVRKLFGSRVAKAVAIEIGIENLFFASEHTTDDPNQLRTRGPFQNAC